MIVDEVIDMGNDTKGCEAPGTMLPLTTPLTTPFMTPCEVGMQGGAATPGRGGTPGWASGGGGGGGTDEGFGPMSTPISSFLRGGANIGRPAQHG